MSMNNENDANISYLEHAMLKPRCVEKRFFQLDLAATALKGSSLVVVPTGLGKTIIALIVLLARMDKGTILFWLQRSLS
jgi:Fanconi anemia group M protein